MHWGMNTAILWLNIIAQQLHVFTYVMAFQLNRYSTPLCILSMAALGPCWFYLSLTCLIQSTNEDYLEDLKLPVLQSNGLKSMLIKTGTCGLVTMAPNKSPPQEYILLRWAEFYCYTWFSSSAGCFLLDFYQRDCWYMSWICFCMNYQRSLEWRG